MPRLCLGISCLDGRLCREYHGLKLMKITTFTQTTATTMATMTLDRKDLIFIKS